MFDRLPWLGAMLALVATAASAEGGALGDPTRPTALDERPVARASSGPAPRWQLQSTLVSAGRRLAVINGRTLRLGDSVAGAKVVDIRGDGVTLNAGGRNVVLRLLPQVADIRKRESTGERE